MKTWDPNLLNLLESLRGNFEVEELDLPESPVFVAVGIPTGKAVTGLKPRLPAGRGLSASQAMLSAAAESVELSASLAQNCDRSRHTFKIEGGLAHILASNITGGADEYFPAQHVYLDWAATANEPVIYNADSNGCASGATWPEALERALLECIERDAMAIWWYGRQNRHHLPASSLDPLAPRLSWWLGHRQRHYLMIDVTSEIGVPVVAAVSFDDDGRRVAMGSAAALDTGQAAILAVTEMIQMEVSMSMGPPNDELRHWLTQVSVKEMKQFRACIYSAERQTRKETEPPTIQKQLEKNGHQVFSIDLTRKHDLLFTCRVIAPTLSPLHGAPKRDRIIAQSLAQPQFDGVKSAEDMDVLQPY
jgi:thiazole/oxazole-forming peptide maturase SagD family component